MTRCCVTLHASVDNTPSAQCNSTAPLLLQHSSVWELCEIWISSNSPKKSVSHVSFYLDATGDCTDKPDSGKIGQTVIFSKITAYVNCLFNQMTHIEALLCDLLFITLELFVHFHCLSLPWNCSTLTADKQTGRCTIFNHLFKSLNKINIFEDYSEIFPSYSLFW